jgi:hypothetical protein
MSTRKQHKQGAGADAPPVRPFYLLPVKVMGRAARDALSMKTEWCVLAVFENSIYIQNQAGQMVCIGPMRFGPGPLNALCVFPEPIDRINQRIYPGSTVTHDGRSLTVDARLRFSFTRCRVWEPPAFSAAWSFEAFDQGLKTIRGEWKHRYPREGLASLIPFIMDPAGASEKVGSPLACMARKPVESLFHWITKAMTRKSDLSADGIKWALEQLIGLGPGLTPSGDDLMGGVLIALHALGHKDIAESLARAILSMALRRTPVISYEHLKCAAEGQGNAALHRILSTVNEQKPDRLPRWLGIIDTVGHTSGWDAVTGLVLVLKAAADSIGDNGLL